LDLERQHPSKTPRARRRSISRSIRSITIASLELRLIELPLSGRADKRSRWVELFDLTVARSIDSRGCHDLAEAAAVIEYVLALPSIGSLGGADFPSSLAAATASQRRRIRTAGAGGLHHRAAIRVARLATVRRSPPAAGKSDIVSLPRGPTIWNR
jgi:hypothetical protein